MNINKLKEQAEGFLMTYPEGFQHPEMLDIAKRHNIAKLVTQVQTELAEDVFRDPDQALETIGKLMSRSSLVSVFEKTAFKNHLNGLPPLERADLADGFRELLHGNQEQGFMRITSLLSPYKLAKWPIVTALLYYSNPTEELVIKPTTVKGVIDFFELEGIVYQTQPTYEFYRQYREQIHLLKASAGEDLQVENGAFCGFLMYAVGGFR